MLMQTVLPLLSLNAVVASIVLRLQFHPGVGVGLGSDYTLYALKEGIVAFKQSKYINSVSL